MTTTTMLAMVIKEKVGWSSWGWFPIRVVLMRISLIRLVLWVSHQGGLYVAKFLLGWSLWGWSLIRVVFMRVVSHQCGPWVVSHQYGLYEGGVSSGWSLWGFFSSWFYEVTSHYGGLYGGVSSSGWSFWWWFQNNLLINFRHAMLYICAHGPFKSTDLQNYTGVFRC